MDKNIATVSKTLEIMKKYDFHLKKSLGQNFLVDVNILNKIVNSAEITNETGVIEIGPGLGSLTEQLLKKAKKVVCYEIDKKLIPILTDTLGVNKNLKIIHEDVLKANVKEMIDIEFSGFSDIAVVANLPYYITTPILMKLIEQKLPINRYIVMMQKEVAQRLCGGPNSKDYNALTIAVQYYTQPQVMMNVPKTVFIPKPNVDSTVIKLTKRIEPAVIVKDVPFFFKVVRGSFIQRRKTIYNNLKQSLRGLIENETIAKVFEAIDINPSLRGEALTVEQFAKLSDELHRYIK